MRSVKVAEVIRSKSYYDLMMMLMMTGVVLLFTVRLMPTGYMCGGFTVN